MVSSLEHGVYDIAASVRGYCDQVNARALGTEAARNERAERSRLVGLRADRVELELDEQRGALRNVEKIRRQDFKIARILRNNLESMPDRIGAILAGESDPDQVHDLLSQAIAETLESAIDAMASLEVDSAQLDITRTQSREAIAADG